MTANFPARLFVLLARNSPVGVVLRRGPSDWVQMIRWDTKKDIFTPGQWFHGRIYEHKCDLSPNGELFIYFAKKFTGIRYIEGKHFWTAISKPPYFTALDIEFQIESWGGGGIFTERREVIWGLDLNGWHKRKDLSVNPGASLSGQYRSFKGGLPYNSVDRLRHHLDGWIEIGRDEGSQYQSPRLTWQKCVKDYTLTFHETHSPRNPHHMNAYFIKRDRNEIEFPLDGVLWADFDYRGRFVLAKEGKLFSATILKNELRFTELADFNANQPEPVEAPEWAQRW